MDLCLRPINLPRIFYFFFLWKHFFKKKIHVVPSWKGNFCTSGHYKAAAILFFASAILVNSLPTSDEKSNYLLPKDLLKVISYDISLELKDDFYKTKAFVGEVAIKFQALKDATSIKIHYVNDLKPENVVFKQGYDNITVTINKLAKYDMYEIKFKEKLTVNKEYDLLIHYDGTLRVKDMYGFYLSSYKNKDKDE